MKPKIRESFLTVNLYSRPGQKLAAVTHLVFHWTGNPMSSAQATRNYFESLKDGALYAGAQFCIDDLEIVQCMPDDELAYHAGPDKARTPWALEAFPDSVHLHTIGVEHSHSDWTGVFSPAVLDKSKDLFAWLCTQHKLDPMERIIRHWDVTNKDCPRWFVSRVDEWAQFKLDVQRRLHRRNREGRIGFSA